MLQVGHWSTPSDILDDFDVLRRKVEETFTSSRSKLKAALDEIATVIQLSRLCGVRRKILFRPTLSKNAEVSDYQSPADISTSVGASCSSAYAAASRAKSSHMEEEPTRCWSTSKNPLRKCSRAECTELECPLQRSESRGIAN